MERSTSLIPPPPRRYRLLLSTFLVILVVLVYRSAMGGLLPYLFAILLAYILLPVVNYLDRLAPTPLRERGISRPLAILLVYLTIGAIVAMLLSFILPPFIQQLVQLINALPSLYNRALEIFEETRTQYESIVSVEIRKTLSPTCNRAYCQWWVQSNWGSHVPSER